MIFKNMWVSSRTNDFTDSASFLNRLSYLLRGKGEWIRAFLSAEYVAYNNSEIAQTAEMIVSQEKSFRHAHIHLTEYEMTRRMAEAVGEGFKVSSELLDAFLKTREEPIRDPVETIRKIAEARQLSQKLTDEVVSSYLVEPSKIDSA